MEGMCSLMRGVLARDPVVRGKVVQIQALFRRWRVKQHLGGWFKQAVARRTAAAAVVAQQVAFLEEVRRQSAVEEAAGQALRREQGKVELEVVWAKRAEGWKAEWAHLRARAKQREHRRQLAERYMMLTQPVLFSGTRGRRILQYEHRQTEFDELEEELEKDTMLGPMDEDELEQWWADGMKEDDLDEW